MKDTVEVRVEYKRELNQTRLLLECAGNYEEDYQMRMLQENEVFGLLRVYENTMDGKSVYAYEVGGKQTLENAYKRKTITAKEMKRLLNAIKDVVNEARKYLLDPDCLLIDPAYIFEEKEAYYFCYCPQVRHDIRIAFHKLTEFFVQHTDYQDIVSVKIAFLLHKETMEENYMLDQILGKIEQEEQMETNRQIEETRRRNMDILFSNAVDEVIEYEGEMKGEDHFWTPVKRLLQKHRKAKWGDFAEACVGEDDIYYH